MLYFLQHVFEVKAWRICKNKNVLIVLHILTTHFDKGILACFHLTDIFLAQLYAECIEDHTSDVLFLQSYAHFLYTLEYVHIHADTISPCSRGQTEIF